MTDVITHQPRCAADLATADQRGGSVASIHSWDTSVGVDGPGPRFVVFFAGCPLRCLYCHNPETWHMRDGATMTIDAVLARASSMQRFLKAGGGGVTASGGEPLLQARFVEEFFVRSGELGLHTALDTSGFLGARASDSLLAATDLVLLDIKSWDRSLYRRLTSAELSPTLAFAERLAAARVPVWLRFVVVPGLTDDPANVEGIARFAATLGNVDVVDVLPFHRMGTAKYAALGIPFPLKDVEPPDEATVERVRQQFTDQGLTAR
ncbi:MAG: pyruvate formate lyase activating enzyme [Frankiaceae bacterium]|nr:pyruvate formate lyase activating enzyme [Frankiaceae bacterium]